MENRKQVFEEPIDISTGYGSGFRPDSMFGVMSGYGAKEKKFYDDIESMIKLRVESKTFADVNAVLADMAKMNKVYVTLGRRAKRIRMLTLKRMLRDYKKGLKEIDKKIPVFVELPKYEKKGDGYVKKDGKSDEITVNPPLTSSVSDMLIEQEEQRLLGVPKQEE